MAQASDKQGDEKRARLAAALRENLKRRKAQARAAAGTGPERPADQPRTERDVDKAGR